MKVYFKSIFFFYFFLVKSEKKYSCSILLNTNLFFSLDFISYHNFRSGVLFGSELFDVKLGISQKFWHAGLFIDIMDFYIAESFLISTSVFGKIKSLQSIDIIGGKVVCSFRTWEFPINIGMELIYSKTRPELSIGMIIMFDYAFYERCHLGGSIGVLYMIGRNIENVFELDDGYYMDFLNSKLDSNCLKLLKKNRGKLSNSDAYYAKFKESLDLQRGLKDKIITLDNLFMNEQFDEFDKELEEFDKVRKKLYLCIKNMFKIAKEQEFDVVFFTSSQVKSLKLFWKRLLLNIKKSEEIIKEKKVISIKEYLNDLVLKKLFKPKYLIEILDKFLDESEIQKRTHLLDEEEDVFSS